MKYPKTIIAGFAIIVATTNAHAADVTIIHGINGIDLSAARAYPVDIAINGVCSLQAVQFTQSKRISLDKGSHRITVHPTDGTCAAAAVIDKAVTIDDTNSFASLSAIASLTESGTPQLAVYDNNKSYSLSVAVAVRHLAYAPALFAKIDVTDYPRGAPKRIKNGDYGETFAAWTDTIPYKISISSRRNSGALARLKGRTRSSRVTWRIFHIVGSVKNGLAIIKQDVLPGK